MMGKLRGGELPQLAAAILLAVGGEFALSTAVAAQDLAIPPVTFPTLPRQAASAQGFVPAGWSLEAQAAGDLDRDGIPDLALVLRQTEPKNVVANENGLGENPLDTNPRILAVALRSGPSGDYVLRLENHMLIPRRDDPVFADPLSESGGISIKRGALRVSLYQFASAGGWGMSTTTYSFQLRGGRFVLIGFDRDSVTRNTGETKAISIDYLAGKMKIAHGTISSDASKVVWKMVAPRPPTINEIGSGLEFDPER